MKLLFATKNPAKIKKFKNELSKKGIEVITINDIDVNVNVEESGKNAIENATIKAKAYYEATKIPTIGMDNCLFFENIPEEKQPGTHVRRVGGKELSDEEMINYYSSLAKKYGGKIIGKWIYGLVLCTESGMYDISWEKANLWFTDKASNNINPGYPLDSIAIVPEFNKYLVDLTDEEREIREANDANKDDHVADFIVKNIKQ